MAYVDWTPIPLQGWARERPIGHRVQMCRFFLATAAAAAVLGAACSSSISNPPIPRTSPTPPFPANGTSYSYAALAWGMDWSGGKPRPVPTTPIFTRAIRAKTGAEFGGRQDLIDFHYDQIDSAVKTVGDQYVQWKSLGTGEQLQEIADISASSNQPGTPYLATSARTVYSQPLALVRFPFSTGNRWDGAVSYRTVM